MYSAHTECRRPPEWLHKVELELDHKVDYYVFAYSKGIGDCNS